MERHISQGRNEIKREWADYREESGERVRQVRNAADKGT
jgi:hypothetical protein